jgi:hypothetical protein
MNIPYLQKLPYIIPDRKLINLRAPMVTDNTMKNYITTNLNSKHTYDNQNSNCNTIYINIADI